MTLHGPHPSASPSTLRAYQAVAEAQSHLRQCLLNLSAALELDRARIVSELGRVDTSERSSGMGRAA